MDTANIMFLKHSHLPISYIMIHWQEIYHSDNGWPHIRIEAMIIPYIDWLTVPSLNQYKHSITASQQITFKPVNKGQLRERTNTEVSVRRAHLNIDKEGDNTFLHWPLQIWFLCKHSWPFFIGAFSPICE